METAQRIISKTHELFMRYGIRSVSMDDIAYHLGMSKKTIYQYFADKDALVDGVLEIEIQRNHRQCELHKQNKENAIHEIFMAIDDMQDMLKQLNTSIVHDIQKYHPKSFQKLNEHKQEFFYKIIKDNLECGIQEGLYRPEIQVDILAKFHIESIFVVMNGEVFPTSKYSIPKVSQEVLENFLYGIASLEGIQKIQQYKIQRQNPITHEQAN
jgi:TetR/AcrR family transcriptional regulator, cholesterol catabolism regulator